MMPLDNQVSDGPGELIVRNRERSSLGISSLVLGVVAYLSCWIPFVGILGIPLSSLGLLLGLVGLIVALTRKGSGIGFCIAGVVACGISFTTAILVTGAAVKGLESLADGQAKKRETNQTVVGGDASTENGEQEPTAANTAEEYEWAPADRPVLQGDALVRVVSAVVGKIPLGKDYEGEQKKSKDSFLSLKLEIWNINETRKLDYTTWSGQDFSIERDYATVKDMHGNTYKRMSFGYTEEPEGSVGRESIYPGKCITDILVFEPPIEKAEYLDLELPASNFGGTGMLRIRIPLDLIYKKALATHTPDIEIRIRTQQLPDDLTIVEGVGYGPFKVGASREELVGSLGDPDAASTNTWLQWKEKYFIHCLIDETRGAFELRFDEGFNCPLTSGIRIGSKIQDVRRAYGDPTSWKEKGNGLKLIYAKNGVLFWTSQGRVTQIVIFKPQ